MVDHGIEILLVEDNANDEMLALHAFKKHKIANDVYVVRDGAEALEYIFCTGAYAERTVENPNLILLDLKLPKVDGIEVCGKSGKTRERERFPWWCSRRRTRNATSRRPTHLG